MSTQTFPRTFEKEIESLLSQGYIVDTAHGQILRPQGKYPLPIHPMPGVGIGATPKAHCPGLDGNLVDIPVAYFVARQIFGVEVYKWDVGYADGNPRHYNPTNLKLVPITTDPITHIVVTLKSLNNAQRAFSLGYKIQTKDGRVISPSGQLVSVQLNPERKPRDIPRVSLYSRDWKTVIHPAILVAYAVWGPQRLEAESTIVFSDKNQLNVASSNLRLFNKQGVEIPHPDTETQPQQNPEPEPIAEPTQVQPEDLVFANLISSSLGLSPSQLTDIPQGRLLAVLKAALETSEARDELARHLYTEYEVTAIVMYTRTVQCVDKKTAIETAHFIPPEIEGWGREVEIDARPIQVEEGK